MDFDDDFDDASLLLIDALVEKRNQENQLASQAAPGEALLMLPRSQCLFFLKKNPKCLTVRLPYVNVEV